MSNNNDIQDLQQQIADLQAAITKMASTTATAPTATPAAQPTPAPTATPATPVAQATTAQPAQPAAQPVQTAPTASAASATATTLVQPAAKPANTWDIPRKMLGWLWAKAGCLTAVLIALFLVGGVIWALNWAWTMMSAPVWGEGNSSSTGEVILIVTSTPQQAEVVQPTAAPVQPTAVPAPVQPTVAPLQPTAVPAPVAPKPLFTWNSGEAGSTSVPAGSVCNGDKISIVGGPSYGDGPRKWDGTKEIGGGSPVVVVIGQAAQVTAEWGTCAEGVDPKAQKETVEALYGPHEFYSWP